MAIQQTHESYSRDESNVPGSERSFGFVMAVAFALLAALNLWHAGRVWPWTGGVAISFFVTAWLYPRVLRPFNWIWFKFGLLLHKIVSPLIMAILFYVTILPIGLILRALGKDMLRLRREPARNSYWLDRRPPGPLPETMKDQF
jgi:hypothetical protein